jgi:hypothetical protein
LHSIAGSGGLADAAWPMFQHDLRHSGRDPHAAVGPATCGSVTATDGTYSDRVRVSWLSVSNARAYEVWRNTVNDLSTAVRVADKVGGQTFYDDRTAVYGTTNFYWVRAVNGLGAGDFGVSDTGFLRAPLLAKDVPAAVQQKLPLNLDTSKLLASASNSLPYPMTVSAVAAVSTNGGIVHFSGATITYNPRSGFLGADRFAFAITDNQGGTGSANVVVTVWPNAQGSANMLPLLPTVSGRTQVGFAGVPGRTYGVQRAASAYGPWTRLASITVPSNGISVYEDANPPTDGAFYRTIYP